MNTQSPQVPESSGAARKAGLWYGIAAAIVIIDQLTKYYSNTLLIEGRPVTVFPGFDLLLAYNRGAAFSFLNDADGWQRWLLTGISLGVSLFLVTWIRKITAGQTLLGLSLAMILGGALGNLYDRMMAGYVIDFISVYAGDYRFATFNIADAAISVGAGLMILDILLDGRQAKKEISEE
jgi:signal peptidase II